MKTPSPKTPMSQSEGPCPGPIPTSAAHAERCRACGKCGALSRLFETLGEAAGDAAARTHFSAPFAFASE
jgi:hypothetical protein